MDALTGNLTKYFKIMNKFELFCKWKVLLTLEFQQIKTFWFIFNCKKCQTSTKYHKKSGWHCRGSQEGKGDGSVPSLKKHNTVLLSKKYHDWTVPSHKKHRDGKVSSAKKYCDGTVLSSKNYPEATFTKLLTLLKKNL